MFVKISASYCPFKAQIAIFCFFFLLMQLFHKSNLTFSEFGSFDNLTLK